MHSKYKVEFIREFNGLNQLETKKKHTVNENTWTMNSMNRFIPQGGE